MFRESLIQAAGMAGASGQSRGKQSASDTPPPGNKEDTATLPSRVDPVRLEGENYPSDLAASYKYRSAPGEAWSDTVRSTYAMYEKVWRAAKAKGKKAPPSRHSYWVSAAMLQGFAFTSDCTKPVERSIYTELMYKHTSQSDRANLEGFYVADYLEPVRAQQEFIAKKRAETGDQHDPSGTGSTNEHEFPSAATLTDSVGTAQTKGAGLDGDRETPAGLSSTSAQAASMNLMNTEDWTKYLLQDLQPLLAIEKETVSDDRAPATATAPSTSLQEPFTQRNFQALSIYHELQRKMKPILEFFQDLDGSATQADCEGQGDERANR